MFKSRKSGYSGNFLLEFSLTVVLIVVIVMVIIGVVNFFSRGGTQATIYELERGKPIGLMWVIRSDQMPEEIRSKNPNMVMARYMSFIGDREHIPAQGWAAISATERQLQERGCASLKTASMIFHAFQPTIPSAERGEKVYVMPVGITGVCEGGQEAGTFLPAPNYDPNFYPSAKDAGNPFNQINCTLRRWVYGGGWHSEDCRDTGFRPVANYVRNTPIEDESGIQIVFSYAFGIWVEPVDMMQIEQVFELFEMDAAVKEEVDQFLSFEDFIQEIGEQK